MGTFRKKDRLSIEDEQVLFNERDKLIKIFTDLLNEFNVKWFTDWGTLLGYERERNYIRHDNDMDFSVFPETITGDFLNALVKHKKLTIIGKTNKEFIKKVDKIDGHLTDYCGGPTVYLRDENGEIKKVKGRSVKLDMFFAWKFNDFYIYRWSMEFYKIPTELIESEIESVTFRGNKINVHKRRQELLSWYYTQNWKIPQIGFHKKHCIPRSRYFFDADDNEIMIKSFKYDWKNYKVIIDTLKNKKTLF